MEAGVEGQHYHRIGRGRLGRVALVVAALAMVGIPSACSGNEEPPAVTAPEGKKVYYPGLPQDLGAICVEYFGTVIASNLGGDTFLTCSNPEGGEPFFGLILGDGNDELEVEKVLTTALARKNFKLVIVDANPESSPGKGGGFYILKMRTTDK